MNIRIYKSFKKVKKSNCLIKNLDETESLPHVKILMKKEGQSGIGWSQKMSLRRFYEADFIKKTL